MVWPAHLSISMLRSPKYPNMGHWPNIYITNPNIDQQKELIPNKKKGMSTVSLTSPFFDLFNGGSDRTRTGDLLRDRQAF